MLLDRLIRFFCSIKLTVACLVLGLVIVFLGTMAQVDLGLYRAQNEFFRSFLIYWGPKDANWKIPVLPGGYLVGGILLINLLSSHYQRFTFSRKKAGIWMVHFGLILLLVGQLGTDLLSRESRLHLREGQVKNYTETETQTELAVIDTSQPDVDTVVAIPQAVLAKQDQIQHHALPFIIRVKNFYANSKVENRAADSSDPPAATQGLGTIAVAHELPRVTEMEVRDVPSAIIELTTAHGASLGTWLVSDWIDKPQMVTVDNHNYELVMRPRRFYKPYSIQLLNFQHDVYAGTMTPKNFSSRVLLNRPETGEKREVDIYMNNPLRYAGETYYQSSYDPDDKGTVLQVVRNPSWLTPYFSCVLVGLGLILQFATHLFGFTFKRKNA